MSICGESDKCVTLIASVKGSEVVRQRVKKYVLEHESSFLKQCIQGGAAEVKIPLRRPENLHVILKYFYEDQLVVSEENLESLWNDARILGLLDLQKACIQRMAENISVECWIKRLQFSQAEGVDELESNVLNFVRANFEKCCSSSSFTSLSVDQVAQVLRQSSEKTTDTESYKIARILDWIEMNEADRYFQAHRLLEIVDLKELTEHHLRLLIDEESAFRHWCSVSMFDRIIRLKKSEEAMRESVAVPSLPDGSKVPICESPNHELPMPESSDHNTTINQKETSKDSTCNPRVVDLETHASNQKAWRSPENGPSPAKIPRLEYPQVETESLVAIRSKQILYLRKSNNGNVKSLSFVIISGDTISQPQTVQMNLPKYALSVAKLIWCEAAGRLIFLGEGEFKGHALSNVHYLSGNAIPDVNGLPSMLTPRHRFQPVILNGNLYAMGGSNWTSYVNNARISSAEVLDLTAVSIDSQWQAIDPMPAKRENFAAGTAKGKVYVTGGVSETLTMEKVSLPTVTNSVLCYEPTKNKWNYVSSMNLQRRGHSLVAFGHNIYVFGGSGSDPIHPPYDLDSMKIAEVYDIQEDKWTIIAPMLRPRYGGSAVVVGDKIYIIGGDWSRSWRKRQPSVECYDPAKNSWILVSESVDDHGFFNSVAVIDNPASFLKSI